MLFFVEAWVLPVTLLTALVCAVNFREVFSMAQKLLGMVAGQAGTQRQLKRKPGAKSRERKNEELEIRNEE